MTAIAELERYLASRILSESAFAQYRLGDVSHRELQPYSTALRGISQAYVSHDSGTKLASPIPDTLAAQAYALYYTPINAAKILHLLPLLNFDRPEVSVLDVGCGPGTAVLSLLLRLNKKLRITCVESSPPMSELARRLISSWDINNNLLKVTMRSTLRPADDTHDLVVAANVLAELDAHQSQSLLDSLAHLVSPGGYLLLLEPGQQHHTRQLMRLRDRVISEHSSLIPLFPCLRADSCPMLSDSTTDWCHDTLEWRQPPLNAQFDHLLGFNKHRIKYAAFLFQRHGALREGLRVITPPRKTRIGSEALVCGESFYGVARLRKSARSEHNKAFEKAQVFERLLVSGRVEQELSADTAFKKSDTL